MAYNKRKQPIPSRPTKKNLSGDIGTEATTGIRAAGNGSTGTSSSSAYYEESVSLADYVPAPQEPVSRFPREIVETVALVGTLIAIVIFGLYLKFGVDTLDSKVNGIAEKIDDIQSTVNKTDFRVEDMKTNVNEIRRDVGALSNEQTKVGQEQNKR